MIHILAILTLAIYAFPDPRYAAAVGALWVIAATVKQVRKIGR